MKVAIFLILISFIGCTNYENSSVEIATSIREAPNNTYNVYFSADCHFGIFYMDYVCIGDTQYFGVPLDSINPLKERYRIKMEQVKIERIEKRKRERQLDNQFN